MPEGERIAKFIARSGICSRRNAEQLILSGRVKIDGKIITSPAINILPENKVEVDGKNILPTEAARLFIFHKPKGIITSNKDENGRKTLFEILPKTLPRLISVGRLDYNTEGLILLTNSGELARKLELPQTGLKRKYLVRVRGLIDEKKLNEIRRGIRIDGIKYKPAEVEISGTKENGRNFWLTFSISEGKNREIRKFCAYIGLEVSRLIRISYGKFELKNLEKAGIIEIPAEEFKEFL